MDQNQLLQKAAAGDQTAFATLYDKLAPKVLGVLMALLGDRYAAEDVLQEAMTQAWLKSQEFDPRVASASTWITAIARHRALDQLRKTGRYQRLIREDQQNIVLMSALNEQDRQPESGATNRRLENCFGELSKDSAVCIQLAYLSGLSFPEISHTVERSLGTVKSWIRRGMERLKRCMQL